MMIQDIIKKFNFEVVNKDGQQMLKTFRKPTAQEATFIKTNKPAIIDEILRQEAERKAAQAEKERKTEEERQRLIETGEAKLAIVYYGSYLLEKEIAYVVKMSDEEQQKYNEDFRGKMHKKVKKVYECKDIRKAVEALGLDLGECQGYYTGSESVIFYITKEQMEQIKNWIENEKARAKAEEETKAKAEEEKKQTIFAKAKETGEKQVFERYTVECDDPHKECSTDIITVWAMPDGTIGTTRTHTY